MPATRRETVEFVDTAPFTVQVERTIAASPQTIFDALADAPSWVKWFPTLSSCEYTSDEHGGLGSTRRVGIPGGIVVDEEFIAWDPASRFGFTFLETNKRVVAAGVELVELTPTADGATHVRYSQAIEPAGMAKLIVKISRKRIEKGLTDGLEGLDQYVTRA